MPEIVIFKNKLDEYSVGIRVAYKWFFRTTYTTYLLTDSKDDKWSGPAVSKLGDSWVLKFKSEEDARERAQNELRAGDWQRVK